MHEYLFRGKRKDNGEWVEGSLVTKVDPLLETNYCFILAQGRGESFVTWHMVDPATVGQFTGLMDKNGKRIFEGDIVRFEYTGKNLGVEGVETVIFECGKFGVKWGWHKDFVCLDGFANTTKEIIGNIHDNPELIGGRFDVGYTFRV